MDGIVLLIIILMVITTGILICTLTTQQKVRQRITHDVQSSEFIYYKDFEKRWIVSSERGQFGSRLGFKYQDGPGCYVITIFDHPAELGPPDAFENVYVGQSLNICQRVHAHFTGKGNGDVYADIKYGKWVYVSLIRCDKCDMNRMEKELIVAFNATRSYNKTRGGAQNRGGYRY